MSWNSAISLVAALTILLASCGPKRIPKLTVPQEDEIRAIRLVLEGDGLLQDGKDHLALLKYMEASELNPYHEVIFNKLAVTYLRLGRTYQARQAVNRAIGLNPDYAYAYHSRGIIDLAEQQIKEAVRSLEKAIDLAPGVASFHVNLGFAYVKANQPEKALAAYNRALAIDPDLFETRDFIEMTFESESAMRPDEYYDLARVFAEMGILEYCLKYLGRAFGAGFEDYDRLLSDDAFAKFRNQERFVEFLRVHGVNL